MEKEYLTVQIALTEIDRYRKECIEETQKMYPDLKVVKEEPNEKFLRLHIDCSESRAFYHLGRCHAIMQINIKNNW